MLAKQHFSDEKQIEAFVLGYEKAIEICDLSEYLSEC